MEALPAYLDSEAGKKEETGRAVAMLTQMAEFEEFKEMMMYVKKDRKDKASGMGDIIGDTKVTDKSDILQTFGGKRERGV